MPGGRQRTRVLLIASSRSTSTWTEVFVPTTISVICPVALVTFRRTGVTMVRL